MVDSVDIIAEQTVPLTVRQSPKAEKEQLKSMQMYIPQDMHAEAQQPDDRLKVRRDSQVSDLRPGSRRASEIIRISESQ